MPESDLATKKKEAETLKSVEISRLSLQWLQVLAEGWASPMSGKRLNHGRYLCVASRQRTKKELKGMRFPPQMQDGASILKRGWADYFLSLHCLSRSGMI